MDHAQTSEQQDKNGNSWSLGKDAKNRKMAIWMLDGESEGLSPKERSEWLDQWEAEGGTWGEYCMFKQPHSVFGKSYWRTLTLLGVALRAQQPLDLIEQIAIRRKSSNFSLDLREIALQTKLPLEKGDGALLDLFLRRGLNPDEELGASKNSKQAHVFGSADNWRALDIFARRGHDVTVANADGQTPVDLLREESSALLLARMLQRQQIGLNSPWRGLPAYAWLAALPEKTHEKDSPTWEAAAQLMREQRQKGWEPQKLVRGMPVEKELEQLDKKIKSAFRGRWGRLRAFLEGEQISEAMRADADKTRDSNWATPGGEPTPTPSAGEQGNARSDSPLSPRPARRV